MSHADFKFFFVYFSFFTQQFELPPMSLFALLIMTKTSLSLSMCLLVQPVKADNCLHRAKDLSEGFLLKGNTRSLYVSNTKESGLSLVDMLSVMR